MATTQVYGGGFWSDPDLHSVTGCAIICAVAGVAQLVERHLAKVQVAGSNPVSRSTHAV